MRLIDADKAQKQLDMAIANNNNPLLLATEVKEFLEVQPTVEERKHGHWKRTDRYWWECSVCGGKNWIDRLRESDSCKTPYCPHCGAKMDEVNSNDQSSR